jgi:hypothetical protein
LAAESRGDSRCVCADSACETVYVSECAGMESWPVVVGCCENADNESCRMPSPWLSDCRSGCCCCCSGWGSESKCKREKG